MSKVAIEKGWHRGYIAGLRRAIFILLGDACVSCGETDRVVLEINHKHGGGTRHRKRRGGGAYFRDILASIKKYDLRCGNCHRRTTRGRLHGTR